MEYKKLAKYYDAFYYKKDYIKEVEFLGNFIKSDDEVIDIGCGTGIHASILEKDNKIVDGLDLNEEMIKIAKTRLKGTLYKQNMLNIKIDKKYDVIISMFAVINHLNSINELETVLNNFNNILKENGLIILDLHNPSNSGSKTDNINNMKRTMTWNFDKINNIETTEIIYEIDNEIYKDKHIFKIFTIDEIKETATKVGLEVDNIYENYDINKNGNINSKNLQFIIKKTYK